MRQYRKSAYIGLAISPTFFLNFHQAGAAVSPPNSVGFQVAQVSDSIQLQAALSALNPAEKLAIAGDRIQLAAASCDAAGGKKSKGACCSKSVKFQCVREDKAGPQKGGASDRKKREIFRKRI